MTTTTPALTSIPSPAWPSNVFPTQLTPAATCGFGKDLWLATLDCEINNYGTWASSERPPQTTAQPDWFTCGPVVNAGRPIVHFTRSGADSSAITTTTGGLEDDCYQNKYGTWGATTQTTDGQTNTYYFATCPVGYTEADHQSTTTNNVGLHLVACCPSHGSLSFGIFSTRTEDILFSTTVSGTTYGGWTIHVPACTAKVTENQVVTVTDTRASGTETTTTTTSLGMDATIFAELQTLRYNVFAEQHTCFRDCGELYSSPGVSEWLAQYTPTGTQTTGTQTTGTQTTGTQTTGSPSPTGGQGGGSGDQEGVMRLVMVRSLPPLPSLLGLTMLLGSRLGFWVPRWFWRWELLLVCEGVFDYG
ncbi:hypothetical protein B0T21DRAFT_137136 [Apiosordaria backusii]|uniref:Uncharacterized protein n=1 Tax=Apiosordaria backusii TaxID=314023 RepID=A0AA40BRK2_9PEZI|nr:hypothetical protein B0T21DRAFT_137136 [Apiosordaria backusii]